MKIVIIDGQGGKIGAALTEKLLKNIREEQRQALTLLVIGSNSSATETMLRAGARLGATGENPVIVNAADADIILGPIGIIVPNAMLGEITPAMAAAVSRSDARKILIPFNRCNVQVVGVTEQSLPDYIDLAYSEVLKLLQAR